MFVIKTVLLVFAFDIAVCSQDNKSCTTPDKKTGQCLPLGNCPSMVNYLNNAPKPISADVKKLLNEYVCNYEEVAVNTKVCCPSEPINPNGEDEEIPPPPNVLNHENLKLLPEECGLIDTAGKIRGGKAAFLREFPWMAILAYKKDGNKFQCGASIINERYILTAAHCVVNTPYQLESVRVGEYNLLSEKDCHDDNPQDCLAPPQDLNIEARIVHPDYSTTSFKNDIALLRVPKINLEPGKIQAVCLPVYEDVVTQEFKNGVVSGWGLTDPYGLNVVDKLQRVELELRNLSVCINAYKVEAKIKLSYKQLCIGGRGVQDSCGGDSGGPFHVPAHFNDDDRYVQRGIVSIGHRFCGTAGFPGVYTRVAYYTKWILDNMKP